MMISIRRIINWCNGVVSFLSQFFHLSVPAPYSMNELNPTPAYITQRIMTFLSDMIMPEIHILSSSSPPPSSSSSSWIEGKIREARMNVSRVILELFCISSSMKMAASDETRNFVPSMHVDPDPTTWAGNLIIRLFTVDIGSGWGGSFEEMLRDFVCHYYSLCFAPEWYTYVTVFLMIRLRMQNGEV